MHTACTNCFKNDVDEPGLSLRKAISPVQNCLVLFEGVPDNALAAAQKSCSTIDGSGICRLVQNLYSNQLLNTHIQACFILHFDLLRRPQLDKPFMARIDIGIEPAEMPNFLNIFLGDQLDAKMKMKGMLQLNALTPLPPGAIADLTPLRMDIWHQARESANRNGFSDDSFGLMEFGNGDGQQTITCPVHIQKAAMDLVRVSPPWVMTSAITGKTTEVPFNIETCMEFINTHIRSDKKDQLLLRTEMRASDIQIIRDAGAERDTYPALILRAKMRRESIFKPFAVGDAGAGFIPLV
ncbi:hypothetical protein B0H14DRAFT_3523112 [Mycena olivaceomarginata]|nr:hypothetical protein B0H14DRAFT_3523112 [Mycena olivaceomarginata]